ncbi:MULTISPECIES: hypothetical protein [unclassified Streptomyces]|uniref:hypothetical protein n=1 Tax=unclassified Streptomyces TaxID=2593676 RepID=UPI002DDAFF86|nr:hypothetical protein [Streptomyces sp. NBC_01750]WSB01098.1 hypothetical protein OIE54_18330 [Streptomyces sp. NBC_01794]WSD34549.1 hypothetical protein OG966_23280 [Streptomyces sp. NBC_01750]
MPRHITAAVLGLICALSLTGCSGAGGTPDAVAAPPRRPVANSTAEAPRPTATPPSAATLGHLADASINITDGGHVGVGLPVSVTFKRASGNGYGDWNLSWSEWRSRSAL